MNLQIRDPRAHKLAKELAELRKVSMTDAVIDALEDKLRRENEQRPLAERVQKITERLRQLSGGKGRDMTKDEIDAMWGHE